MVKTSSGPEIVFDQHHRPRTLGKHRVPVSHRTSSAQSGHTDSRDHVDPGNEEMDMNKLWKEIRCLGTSSMGWKERKKLEDRQVANLGGKPPKRHRIPLSAAKPMMKKQKKLEQKQLEEALLLGQFMKRSRGRREEKRRVEDRVLRATEGHFKGGVLNVKHLLKPQPSRVKEVPSSLDMFKGGKKGKGKGRGKKKGKSRRR